MTDAKATRDVFGETLKQLGHENEKIVVLSGDLEDSTRAEYFGKEFPERFFNLGIAEQDILGTAAGFSLAGFIPFACSFAAFITNRPYGMIRLSVCYNNTNVKIVGSHGGITVGEDGASAQALEDLAITRVLPNMTVVYPVDAYETEKATRAITQMYGPVYMRCSRNKYPTLTTAETEFTLGKAITMRRGADVTIIACGYLVSESLKAADTLAKEGIEARVINMHTIKPLDREAVIQAAKQTGAIVTAEEHQVFGGLGSAVAEVVCTTIPVPMEMVGIYDTFGESGTPMQLLEKYHLTGEYIAEATRKVVHRKK